MPAGECATAKYAQCAGKGFAHEACCPKGFTCHKQDDFYSQCMPAKAPTWFSNILSKITRLQVSTTDVA